MYNGPKVYILGPMRGIPLYNFPAFDAVEKALKEIEVEVVNPARLDREAGFDPEKLPKDHDWSKLPESLRLDDVINRDLAALRTCDFFWALAGWENSVGARAEKALLEWQGAHWLNTPKQENQVAVADSANPKDKIGQRKPQLHLVPPVSLIWQAKVMEDGAKKYGPYNWRQNKVRATVYLSAALRHISALLDGEDVAEDSGYPHAAHAAACMGIILDAAETGNLIDDRPKKGAAARLVKRLTTTK